MSESSALRGRELKIDWDAVIALVLFLLSFAVYARTAAPGVLDGDFGEFQTNIYRLGVSHTGYPLYFLLAKLWVTLLPAGTIAFRANIFSGLFGALTLVLLYYSMRSLTRWRTASLFTAALFGVSRVQWSQSIVPDVYTLNSFFIVFVLWLAVLWRVGRAPLWWLAFAFGLSLAHHRTMMLVAPALAVFLLLSVGRERLLRPRTLWQPGEFIKLAVAFCAPLLLYLYIPLRGASDVGVEYHPSNNINILALNALYDLRFGPPGFIWERITQVYLPLLIEQFTLIGFAMGWVGIAVLLRKHRIEGFPPALPPHHLLALIGLAHLAETAFAIVFWVLDTEIFFIPSYLTFAFFVGIGIAFCFDRLAAVRSDRRVRRVMASAFSISLALWCLYLAAANFPRVDQSTNVAADSRWQEILAEPLELSAILVAPWEDLTPLEYYQYVENLRRDLVRKKIVIYRDQLELAPQGDIAEYVRGKLNEGKAVYLSRHPLDTETLGSFGRFDLIPFKSLWRVEPRAAGGRTTTVTPMPAGSPLLSIEMPTAPISAGAFVKVGLVWEPTDAPRARVLLTLRDPSGMVWAENESETFGGRTPSAPDRSRRLRDPQGLFVPPDAPPAEYILELRLFDRETNAPLTVGDDTVITQTLRVTAPQAALPPSVFHIQRPLEIELGSSRFLGYGTSLAAPAGGDLVELSTWWQGITRGDEPIQITLRDAAGVETMLYGGALLPAAASELNGEQIIRARHTLTLPPTSPAGFADLIITFRGQTLAPLRLAMRESTRKFRVPIIQRPQLALLGDAIQLLGYRLDRTDLRRGETVNLSLYWNANQTPPQSYKVFVHLLDQNGVLRAQHDSPPRNGTLPTDRWFPGEYITDEHPIVLPLDLAPGEYQIQVGMYDERTGERVPTFDGAGQRFANDAVPLSDSIQVRE